ncbi:hypothetical protein [Acinetobacter rudis]|uniref:hypothetical protein n=1 Tax=Acinetobacter rudis TaxID=632955 RepID=UPI0033407F10
MSNEAGVAEVGLSNLTFQILQKNWQGITILGAAEGMGAIGGLAIDSATEKMNKGKLIQVI